MECPNRNSFCYVCGLFTPTKHSRNLTRTIVEAYEGYFVTTYRANLWYVPDIVCDYCHRSLSGWKNKTHRSKYVNPITWLPRSEHSSDLCYFCVNQSKTVGYRYNTRDKIIHENVESVIPAQLRSEENPFAQSENQRVLSEHLPDFNELENEPSTSNLCARESTSSLTSGTTATSFSPSLSELGAVGMPHFITQADFNDLMRDASVSQTGAELIASRLKQWNLVAPDFRITFARKRSRGECNKAVFDNCFAIHEATKITYCKDINGLFQAIVHPYNATEWRLFIDASVESLKAVLLHIGNEFPSVPIAYGTKIPENYETMKTILQLIKYGLHGWRVCCDLKVVGLLTGLKRGYPQHSCFLCLWEGRLKELHYTNHQWPPRVHYNDEESIENEPLIPASKVILPPLHIKLGLIRNFIVALDHNGEAFKHLKTIFPNISNAKIAAGALVENIHDLCLFI